MEPDDKLWHPMRKKVQHGTSGATIYHQVTPFYHRVPQFFIGLCNFSTRLQIPRVPIWNTGLHLYRRGRRGLSYVLYFKFKPLNFRLSVVLSGLNCPAKKLSGPLPSPYSSPPSSNLLIVAFFAASLMKNIFHTFSVV